MNGITRKLKANYNRIFHRDIIEAKLIEAHITPSDLSVVYEHPSIAILVAEVADMWRKTGAKNYLELRMFDSAELKTYVITITVKGHGKTQDEIIRDLKREVAEITSKLSAIDEIQKRVNDSWSPDDYVDGMGDIGDILVGKTIK